MVRAIVLLALVAAAACGREHGPPTPRPMPKIDKATALRGGGPPRSPRNANYKIDARLDPVKHRITATQTLTWTNTGETAVDRLPFHLYLNAFKNEQTLFMRSSRGRLRGARATASGWGYLDITSVRIGGVDLTSTLRAPTAAPAAPANPASPAATPASPPATGPAEPSPSPPASPAATSAAAANPASPPAANPASAPPASPTSPAAPAGAEAAPTALAAGSAAPPGTTGAAAITPSSAAASAALPGPAATAPAAGAAVPGPAPTATQPAPGAAASAAAAAAPPPAAPTADESVVELPLPEPLAPGATIEIAFEFVAQLPEVFARTGYKGEFHMVGQWFPKIGVRVGPPGAERWECQPFHANNEFFADFGTYDVTLTVPSTHVVAATGVLTGASDSADGMRTLTYHAEDVHDFAWMADPYMEVITGEAKLAEGPPVEVRVYFRAEQRDFARRHLEAGIGSIQQFSAMFVPYPWPIMSVIDPPVDATAGAGGMEYPTLVTTAGDSVFARPGVRLPEYVTVHEVGHNWFQGILASNEPEEAWLDEGVNEWADARVMAALYGQRASAIDWMGWQAGIIGLRRAIEGDTSDNPSPIATPAYGFVDSTAYGEQTYGTTMRALQTLENTVGSQRFAAAMKAYSQAFAFRHPTGRDLFATLGKELGQDLSWFFDPVFHRVGGPAIELRRAACRPAHEPRGVFGDGSARRTVTEIEAPDLGSWTCEIIVQNTGTVHVPLEIELKFADGSTQRLDWKDRGTKTWERFVVERSSRLVEVWLDPGGKIVLDVPIRQHYRLDGDGAASLRAGAWFGALTQTLLQIVGP